MKVSVVTISYNQARFLEQAIRSVITQDHPDIQYIVVDAGSTDGSRNIIENYRSQIETVILEPDRGPADGLNKGFRCATGTIYGCLNSDDFLLPGAISTVVEAFKRIPDASVISGHGLVVDEHNKISKRLYSHRFNARMYARGACVLVQPSTFFKNDVFWKSGGFNTENRVGWDGELWVDIALNGGGFARINRTLSAFRMYNDSISGSGKYLDEITREHNRICTKIGISRPSSLGRGIWWLLNRLTDPVTTSLRICDALQFNKYHE